MKTWEKVFYIMLFASLLLAMASCSTGKALLDACKDGLCR